MFLHPQPLTAEAFAPFGEILDPEHARTHYPINGGTTERYHDMGVVDVADGDGRALLSVFRAKPRSYPMHLEIMERHPLGSQAFIPLPDAPPFLIVVAAPEVGY